MEENAFAMEDSKNEEKKSTNCKPKMIVFSKFFIHVLTGLYFGYATYHFINNDINACKTRDTGTCGMHFCTGYGLLLIMLSITYIAHFYFYVLKPKLSEAIYTCCLNPLGTWWMRISRTNLISALSLTMVLVMVGVILYFECRDEPRKLIALITPCFFIGVGYIFSTARNSIQWRLVITGIFCQFLLGILCIRIEFGRQLFQCLGNKVETFLGYAEGANRFVFGDAIINDKVFAFSLLPVIFFFSFFISILHYLGAMQWIVMKLGWILQQILNTTIVESLIAAANIFLSMTESALLIKPYIKDLTSSELHAVMVSGFATVSGSTLAAYISFGASPAHLITSSVMAAPAALAMSKLFFPETQESKTTSENIKLEKSEDTSILDAATNGASNAIPLFLGIIANIVALISIVAFMNGVVNWLGFLVGMDENFNFEWIFSKIFIPFVWALGVPPEDCEEISKVVASKVIINEFMAYERLGEYIKTNQIGARSAGIGTYAICGFANPGSLGIFIGVLSGLEPSKRSLITSVAIRAVIVGTIVCFMSASFAGLFIRVEDEKQMYSNISFLLESQSITGNNTKITS